MQFSMYHSGIRISYIIAISPQTLPQFRMGIGYFLVAFSVSYTMYSQFCVTGNSRKAHLQGRIRTDRASIVSIGYHTGWRFNKVMIFEYLIVQSYDTFLLVKYYDNLWLISQNICHSIARNFDLLHTKGRLNYLIFSFNLYY